jgi:hypothetical protein
MYLNLNGNLDLFFFFQKYLNLLIQPLFPHSIKDYFKLKFKQADIYDDDESFKTNATMTIDKKTMTLRVKIIMLSFIKI